MASRKSVTAAGRASGVGRIYSTGCELGGKVHTKIPVTRWSRPLALLDAELMTRLVRLNHERAREEVGGHVRYLRPAYRASGQQQASLRVGCGAWQQVAA